MRVGVRGTRYKGRGTRYEGLGTRYEGLGTRYEVPGTGDGDAVNGMEGIAQQKTTISRVANVEVDLRYIRQDTVCEDDRIPLKREWYMWINHKCT